MIDRIKDFIEDIKNEIEWILSGCPKPQPIKIPKDKEGKHETKKVFFKI